MKILKKHYINRIELSSVWCIYMWNRSIPHPVPFTQIILAVHVTSRCNEHWVLADYMCLDQLRQMLITGVKRVFNFSCRPPEAGARKYCSSPIHSAKWTVCPIIADGWIMHCCPLMNPTKQKNKTLNKVHLTHRRVPTDSTSQESSLASNCGRGR